MITKAGGASVLRRENLGFALILLLSWVSEAVRVPHLLFGEPDEFNWTRALLRSVVILAVWAWVHFTTRALVRRLHHLEEFLLICSWCRKVGHEGKWLTMEQYFGTHLDTQTSHGICPECSQKTHERLAQLIAEGRKEP